ncbi:MAG: flagellar basal body protein, partial [bacterium]
MPSINSTLSLARRALLAHQTALETTGENIANVNTPGYTRRRPLLTPGPSVTEPPGLTLGSGVIVEKILPVRDALVEQVMGRALKEQAYYTALSENLNHLIAPWND